MYVTHLLGTSIVLALGFVTLTTQASLAASPAATLTIAANGALGAALSGTDSLHSAHKSASMTVSVGEALSPSSHTATSATYKLAAGAITVILNGNAYQNGTPASLKISIPAAGSDTVTVTGPFVIRKATTTIKTTLSLAKGSFTSAALKHPTAFTPASQTLTAATTASGHGSKLSYTISGATTVLGLSGDASCKSAVRR